MDPKLVNNIRNVLSIVTIKKQLSEYLGSKNINPSTMVYPPLIQDIQCIPEISNRIELIPHMEELDPASGNIKVGWNLFVLGTNRLELGYTIHESFSDLKQPEPSKKGMENSLCYTTGEEILNFITKTLQKYDEDHVSLGNGEPQTYGSKMPASNTFYQKNKSVGRST